MNILVFLYTRAESYRLASLWLVYESNNFFEDNIFSKNQENYILKGQRSQNSKIIIWKAFKSIFYCVERNFSFRIKNVMLQTAFRTIDWRHKLIRIFFQHWNQLRYSKFHHLYSCLNLLQASKIFSLWPKALTLTKPSPPGPKPYPEHCEIFFMTCLKLRV